MGIHIGTGHVLCKVLHRTVGCGLNAVEVEVALLQHLEPLVVQAIGIEANEVLELVQAVGHVVGVFSGCPVARGVVPPGVGPVVDFLLEDHYLYACVGKEARDLKLQIDTIELASGAFGRRDIAAIIIGHEWHVLDFVADDFWERIDVAIKGRHIRAIRAPPRRALACVITFWANVRIRDVQAGRLHVSHVDGGRCTRACLVGAIEPGGKGVELPLVVESKATVRSRSRFTLERSVGSFRSPSLSRKARLSSSRRGAGAITAAGRRSGVITV